MKSFLSQIAEKYVGAEADRLGEYCFVFPNRRSGAFFLRYLKNASAGLNLMLPRVATLNELVSECSPLVEASRDEMLFNIFDNYRKISGADVKFERFLFWGAVLVDDFNDVDENLVDASSLFVNVERWKEIQSFYLTPEQIEIIRRYWGDEVGTAEVDRFWKHTLEECDNDTNAKFLKLWEILDPLYERFTTSLAARGLATPGMLKREACRLLSEDDPAVLPARRYVFIGFDVPTGSELFVFRKLQSVGRADFYWDFNSPVAGDPDSRIARLFETLRSDFPPRYPLDEPRIATLPEITVTAVPSSTGQARVAGQTLRQWAFDGKIADTANAIDTAVVLPDESLFIPMIHSVPEQIESMNVTMGFPMKLTPVAGLMGVIVGMHLRSRVSGGERLYFYQDVEALISNPLVRMMMPDPCEELLVEMRRSRLFMVSSVMIEERFGPLALYFCDEGANDARGAYDYITRILNSMISILSVSERHRMEVLFLESYLEAVDDFYDCVRRYEIDMSQSMFFNMVERTLTLATVNFRGEPLRGLQIMGVLETRALDFDNVVVMSMNEKIFPRKAQLRTFIPEAIRHAYGLPTSEHRELQYSYYFFRLLSRASNVCLLYDSRTVATSSGEMSRFLTQLLYLNNDGRRIAHTSAYFKGVVPQGDTISVRKDPHIVAKLNEFRAGGTRSLSPSALKTYLECPLNFCLRFLLQLGGDDEIVDYMESSTLGQIVHKVAEQLYSTLKADGGSGVLTISQAERWIKNRQPVDGFVTRAINLFHLKRDPADCDTPLVGEPRVLGKAIREIINTILKVEKPMMPFEFVAAELPLDPKWKVDDTLTVNFYQVIDRLDRVDGRLRIVDYKTGNEETKIGDSLEKMFDAGGENKLKSIFQVLLYCELYRIGRNDDSAVQPLIYNLREILTGTVSPITLQKQPLTDYHVVHEEFVSRVNDLLREIFDENTPFTQARKPENCTFCKFKEICNRPDTKDDNF
ncbi:MAG: PD-(D/E)XK nuclease family protein [Clostridium sp.]|nr:PD-(D/E)XK nuclease family protein [Clostridium sp.]